VLFVPPFEACVLGLTRVHVGAPVKSHICVPSLERDMISAALFTQNPNPGAVRAYANREIVEASLPAGVVGGHFATVSS
jgi:hypothetical protein